MSSIHWLNGPDHQANASLRIPAGHDAHLLDAYSRAVVGVVEAVELAVVSVEADTGRGGEPRGQGSGFLSRRTATC